MAQKWSTLKHKKKGNIGISAVNATVYTMNHEPIPEVVYEELERFLMEIHNKTNVRLLTSLVRG